MINKIIILLGLLLLTSCIQTSKVLKLNGKTMGTTYHIKYVNDAEISQTKLQQLVDQALVEVNQQMSTYISDSELSKFNQSSSLDWIATSPELLFVVDHALSIAKKTSGVFDPTIGPLVNLWGFGPSGKRMIPSDMEIKKALLNVGHSKVEVDLNGQRMKKSQKEIYLDLSASAKGYGVDKVSALLKEQGIENHMVEIGGEVKTSGLKNQKSWRIAIESPVPGNTKKSLQKVLELNSMAMATSGSYRNFFKKSSKTYSHTINYKTGKPISHTLASVSVVDLESCMNADAFATAFMAMGHEKGLEIAEKLNIPAYFIYKLDTEKEFSVVETSQFKKLFK